MSGQQGRPSGEAVRELVREIHGDESPHVAGSPKFVDDVCRDEWFLTARVARRAQQKIGEGMDTNPAYAEAWAEAESFCSGSLPADVPAAGQPAPVDDQDDEDDGTEETEMPESTGPDFPVTLPVEVEGTTDQGRQVRVAGEVPRVALERYPDERKQDDPMAEFLRDLVSYVAAQVPYESVDPGTQVGTVTFQESGAWVFDRREDLFLSESPPEDVPQVGLDSESRTAEGLPGEELAPDALPDALPAEIGDWVAAPTNFTASRYVGELDDGRAVVVESESVKTVGELGEYEIDVRAFSDGELVANGNVEHGIMGAGRMWDRLKDYLRETTPVEAWVDATGEPIEDDEPAGPEQPPISMPETVGDYTRKRRLDPDEGYGFGTAVYTGNGEVVRIAHREQRDDWDVWVADEVGDQRSEGDTVVRGVDAETAKEMAVDYMESNSAPSEVNGWLRVTDAEGIEYQTPDNTALGIIEQTGDGQWRVYIQRDEMGDERIAREDSRAEAISRLVDALERRDPEGYGLTEDDQEAAGRDDGGDGGDEGWTAGATQLGDPLFKGRTPDGDMVEVAVLNGQRNGYDVVATVRGNSETVAEADSKDEAVDALREFKNEHTPREVAEMLLDTSFAETEGQASLTGDEPETAAAPPKSAAQRMKRLDTPDEIAGWHRVDGDALLPNVSFPTTSLVYDDPFARDEMVHALRLFPTGTPPNQDFALQEIHVERTVSPPLSGDDVREIGTFDSLDAAWDAMTDYLRSHPADDAEQKDDEDSLFQAVQTGLGESAGQAEFDAPDDPGETEIDEPDEEENEGGLMADTREDVGDEDDGPETVQGGLETFQTGGRRDPEQGGLEQFDADDDDGEDDGDDGEGNGDGDEPDYLPVTAGGRRRKAEREGWDEIGPFTAHYENRGLVLFHLPGERDDGPRMALRLNTRDNVWKAQLSEEGKTDPSRMETIATGEFEDAVAALREAVGDEWWQDGDADDQEAALDRMAEQELWNAEIIREAFGVAPNVADTLAEFGRHPGDIDKWFENNDGDFTFIPGVGTDSSRKLREARTKLQSRGVTQWDARVAHMDADDDGGASGETTWADAIEYARQHYQDSFGSRTEFGSDLNRFARAYPGESPDGLTSEGTLQPIVRYQDVPPEDVEAQIANKHGEDDAERIKEIITAFARFHAARDDDTNTVTVTSQGTDYDLPRSGNGWTFTDPSDDPEDGIAHGPVFKARWERGDEVLALKGRGTNHRLFYWADAAAGRDSRHTIAGPESPARLVRVARSIIYGDESHLPDAQGGTGNSHLGREHSDKVPEDLPRGYQLVDEADNEFGFTTWTWAAESDIPSIDVMRIEIVQKMSDNYALYVGPDGARHPRGNFADLDGAVERAKELAENNPP